MRSNIRAQRTSDGVSLAVYGDITPDTATGLLSAFDFFASKPITLSVYSGGGDVFAAIGIRNRMAELDVTARVYGIAASGAAFLLTGAKRVEMTPFSSLMIHSAYKVGDTGERKYDDDTEAIDEMQAEMFAKKTGKRKESVKKWITKEDTFFTAEEAIEMGLADVIYQPERMAASLTNYQPMEQVINEAAQEAVEPKDATEAQAQSDATAQAAEAATEEVVEVEVPVTVTEAIKAAMSGKLKATVNVAARYGEIVAQLVQENKALKAQLDEAVSQAEALAPQAEAAKAAEVAAADAAAKAAEAQAQVEALKATPLEEPLKVDAAPTAQTPAAPAKAATQPVSAHAQRMARTLEALDRRIGKAASKE